MDTELRQFLDAMEGRINANVQHVVTLVTDVKESLEREMNARFGEVHRRFDAVDARFDTQANRLDRQAAFIQTGSRWSNRMTAWAEKVDRDLDKKGQQIEDLRRRNDTNNDGGAQ